MDAVRLLASVLLCVTIVTSYSHFRDAIPNGKNVPHPCRPNYIWKGVGHENQAGGGDRNPFGRDFDANGQIWNEDLCQADSDGDGKTNGEELGDPDCVWKPEDIPSTDEGLSHPGVCEPMASEECQIRNDWGVDCSSPEFECDELDETVDLRNVSIRLNKTAVPPQETTYMCQGLELPSDDIYHVIATQPLIDNENVMHHITVFHCPDNAIEAAKSLFSEPVECDMAPYPCIQIFTIWTLGIYGHCIPPEYGLSMGIGGTKYVVMQMHWNNPQLEDSYEDSSGLMLYYTPTLRLYSGSTMTVGPVALDLPPGFTEISDDGTCPSECTELIFDEDVYISEMIPHMHYLGRKMVVNHYRNGELLSTLVDENDYSYDSPVVYEFDPAVTFRPGDEMSVKCTFDTSNQAAFTFFGDGTSDEMCSVVMMYYPYQANASFCSTYDEISYCNVPLATTDASEACLDEYVRFLWLELDGVTAQLHTKCDPTGLTCMDGCEDLIQELRQNHTCLHEEADEFIKGMVAYNDDFPNEFITMMVSCEDWTGTIATKDVIDDVPIPPFVPMFNSSPAFRMSALVFVLSLGFHLQLW